MIDNSPAAAELLAGLRRAGVVLRAQSGRLTLDAPVGVITPALAALLKSRKQELLAVLCGDYLSAALALVAGFAGAEERLALAEQFDERAGICQHDGGMSRGEGERVAYRELARAVDRAAQARNARAPGRRTGPLRLNSV